MRTAYLLAIGSAAILPFADALVKTLVVEYPVTMIAWARMGISALFVGLMSGPGIRGRLLRPHAPRLQWLRGGAAILGTSMAFLGFRFMPLAECLTLVLIAPILANLISRFWFREPGDRFTWTVALIAFVGVLVITRPGLGVFSSVAVFPLLGAAGLGTYIALTRALAAHDDPRVTTFYGLLVAFGGFSLVLPFAWKMPASWLHAAMFLAIGVMASVANLMQAYAYRAGSTHQLAPISYLSVPIAIGVSWWVFGAVPDGWSLVGMGLIVASGLALVRRS